MPASLWRARSEAPGRWPVLTEPEQADVAIIGAGITGLTTAMESLRLGRSVIVLDSGKVGRGTTGDSTGNLYLAVQPSYQSLEHKHGLETIRAVVASRRAGIRYIEETCANERIACDFHRRPWYFYAPTEAQVKMVEGESVAMARAGAIVRELDCRWPLPKQCAYAFQVDECARFDPLAYVQGLADAVVRAGGRIFEHSALTNLAEEDTHCITTAGLGEVRSEQVVHATHMTLGFNLVQTMAAPYRSYVVEFETADGKYPDGNFWDAAQPHHAISTHPGTPGGPLDCFALAGEHHKTGQSEGDHQDCFERLEAFAREHYPVSAVRRRWSAQHYRPADGLPYIGRTTRGAERTFMATGFSADGLVYGTVAGMLLAAQMAGEEHAWQATYDSLRLRPLASGKDFATENLNVAAQYMASFAPEPRQESFDVLAPGESRVMKVDDERCAAHRDADGRLHVVSAICTHLKCVVAWNDAEQSWDCPCHGSRFSINGEVLEGPALEQLRPVRIDGCS